MENGSAREYVETLMMNWLTSTEKHIRHVPDHEYKQLEQELAGLMKAISSQWMITFPDYTQHDLIGFMQLRLWQALAQNKYDYTKPPKQYFGVVFRNLMRTLNKRVQSANKRRGNIQPENFYHLDDDLTDYLEDKASEQGVLFNERIQYLYVSTRKSTRSLQ
jgi:hypothetical protein